jgi:hypothetical protein
MAVPSPFLEIPRSAWIAENALAFAVRDTFPVGPGHTRWLTCLMGSCSPAGAVRLSRVESTPQLPRWCMRATRTRCPARRLEPRRQVEERDRPRTDVERMIRVSYVLQRVLKPLTLQALIGYEQAAPHIEHHIRARTDVHVDPTLYWVLSAAGVHTLRRTRGGAHAMSSNSGARRATSSPRSEFITFRKGPTLIARSVETARVATGFPAVLYGRESSECVAMADS